MDSFLFYIFLFGHLASLILGFGAVLVTDVFGLLWVAKFKKVTLHFLVSVSAITSKVIWIGWAGLVATGIPLILMKGYVDNLTKLKLFFVLLVGLNGLFLHWLHGQLTKVQERNTLPPLLKFRTFVGSLISQVAWWGALLIGFAHRHWQHTILWPSNPWLYIAGISLAFILLIIGGELVFRNKK
jgi:hypothetical protein